MLNSNEYVIPVGSTILVTGANGYIASHVVNILLQMGYKVRGSVRTEKPWLDQFFNERFGDGVYESVIVPAFDDSVALSEALKDVSGVLHIVSKFNLGLVHR